MRRELAERLFVESGGLDLLSAYGIPPGPSPLEAYSRAYYPTASGKRSAIGAMKEGFLVADGRSIRVFASIVAPENIPENCAVEGLIVPVNSRTGIPSRRLADLAIDLLDAPRPLLVYGVGRSWSRALSRVNPCLDPGEVIVSGETQFVFDRDRAERIRSVALRHGVAKPALLQEAVAFLSGLRCFGSSSAQQDQATRKISELLGLPKALPAEERRARVAALAGDALTLPCALDGASWAMALGMLERDAESRIANQCHDDPISKGA